VSDAAWLNAGTLARLPREVERPQYDLDQVSVGVVHLGPGAFHRAHQAWYFDDALARDPRWGISAVSLKSATLRNALEPQDGLYTVAVLDESIRFRVIGSLRERLVAAADRERVFARLLRSPRRAIASARTVRSTSTIPISRTIWPRRRGRSAQLAISSKACAAGVQSGSRRSRR